MTMFKGLKSCAIASLLVVSANAGAQGFVTNPSAELQQFCNYDTSRRTIIYIDQNIVAKTDDKWFLPILANKSYMPYERIKYKMISADSGAVKDLWETCYPRHTEANMQRLSEEAGIFDKSPEDKQEDAQKYFQKAQQAALGQVLSDTPHQSKPNFNDGFPRKSIAEALYYDNAAFRLEGKTTRVILFSDMVEHSDLVSPAKLQQSEPANLAATVAADVSGSFNNAEFNVYGIGYSHDNAKLNRQLETFWSHWLNYSGADLASFGPQLGLNPESSDVSFTSYTGVMKSVDGMNIATRLRLGATPSSKLYNSWLAIRDIRYPLEGEMVCNKSGQDCSVNAIITFAGQNAKVFKEGDVLRLDGAQNNLKGMAGAPDDLTRTTDGKPYRMKIAFEADASLSF